VTDLSAADQRLSILSRRQRPAFERRVLVLAVGGVLDVVQAEWRDVLVEVVQGEISVELPDGQWHPVVGGDVLWLYGLPVRALHNCGPEVAVLVALRRRDAPAR
jgi:hypothetical protein